MAFLHLLFIVCYEKCIWLLIIDWTLLCFYLFDLSMDCLRKEKLPKEDWNINNGNDARSIGMTKGKCPKVEH